MKKFRVIYGMLLLFFLVMSGVQCKKMQEDIGMKFIIDAMTSGQWVVQVFTDANTDITADFTDYSFQFYKDGKVTAFNVKTSEQVTGTWEGNVDDLTIYSNFPGAEDPLQRLNDTWRITNNTTKLVEASPFNSSRVAYLKLVKKV